MLFLTGELVAPFLVGDDVGFCRPFLGEPYVWDTFLRLRASESESLSDPERKLDKFKLLR